MVLFFGTMIGLAIFGFKFWVIQVDGKNYLFAVILLMIVAIIFLQMRKEKVMMNINITENGILIGGKFFKWNELTKFWII